MMKKFRKLVILVIFCFAILNLAWFYGCYKIVDVVNTNFAGKNLQIHDITVRFSKAIIAGYPNKISVQLLDFTETSKDAQITYNNPVNVGYNILTQRIFVSYNGEIQANLKPISSGAGAKIKGDFNYYIFYPLTPGLIKTVLTTNNYFELINYIRNIQIDFGSATAYDLQSQAKILEQDYLTATLTPHMTTYYKALPELLADIPKSYSLEASSHISIGTGNIHIPLSLIYLHLPTKPLKFNLSSTLITGAKQPNIKDILSDFEVNLSKYSVIYDTFESQGKLYLKNYDKANEMKFEIITNSETLMKKPLFETFKKKIVFILEQLKATKLSEQNAMIFNKIIGDPEKYIPHLHELGKMKTEIDFKFNAYDKDSTINIKKLIFNNNQYGLELYNDTKIKSNMTWSSNGKIIINSYKNFVDLVLGYFQRIALIFANLDKSFVKISDNKFREGIKTFLKRISNTPNSTAEDLSFDINLSSKTQEARIGSVSLEEAKRIYASILAQDLIERVINTKDPKKELEKLAPDLKGKSNDLLDKLKSEQKKLNPAMLKKLFK